MASNEPSPPPSGGEETEEPEQPEQPEPESEDEAAAGEVELAPFFDVGAYGEAQIQVRAGWIGAEDGEIQSLVMDFMGPPEIADQAYRTAFMWYVEAAGLAVQPE
jgi:hypothetical protein